MLGLMIAYRNLDSSPAVEEQINERFADLEKLGARIESCDVVIEAGDRRKVSGREFTVRLKIAVPGPDIDVERRVDRGEPAADVNLAIREAFDVARREILERKSRQGA
ncbi:HPF/RaiA family ribosome-associated protein [Chelativorans sp. Marseille-P2723]|uniref:HPF/RaiA family ribosome-associated protein n=1 Tax=Chelativorans sp. Marseille-P2723 TaxID=2709133 RepID=UPI00156E3079|nr:HPF/RaiA family ribosome-associated protein [Chelativorans sp. Marseille-P2723]